MSQIKIECISCGKDLGFETKRGVLLIPSYLLGHEEVPWVEGEDSFEEAKKIFKDKLKLGWCAFKEVTEKGLKAWKRIKRFDRKVGRILLLPLGKQLTGGG